jgi:hypothetical protein
MAYRNQQSNVLQRGGGGQYKARAYYIKNWHAAAIIPPKKQFPRTTAGAKMSPLYQQGNAIDFLRDAYSNNRIGMRWLCPQTGLLLFWHLSCRYYFARESAANKWACMTWVCMRWAGAALGLYCLSKIHSVHVRRVGTHQTWLFFSSKQLWLFEKRKHVFPTTRRWIVFCWFNDRACWKIQETAMPTFLDKTAFHFEITFDFWNSCKNSL